MPHLGPTSEEVGPPRPFPVTLVSRRTKGLRDPRYHRRHRQLGSRLLRIYSPVPV